MLESSVTRDDIRVAVVGTGGLSHQLTGPSFGRLNPEWDLEFLDLIERDPHALKTFSMNEFAERGGEHSVEIVQWMAMRAAVGDSAVLDYKFYYPYQIMGYGGAGFAVPS